LILGIVDLGRGIYLYNGVSQAAREIARSASVHPGVPLGSSPETAAVIRNQMNLVPGMHDPRVVLNGRYFIFCEDLQGLKVGTTGHGEGGCAAPDVVRVEVLAHYEPAALLGLGGSFDLLSSSSNQVQ
jgi:hypothetical protein